MLGRPLAKGRVAQPEEEAVAFGAVGFAERATERVLAREFEAKVSYT